MLVVLRPAVAFALMAAMSAVSMVAISAAMAFNWVDDNDPNWAVVMA